MRCERCGHPRASSSRSCFVTTPLRAAIGLQKALPRGEGGRSSRRCDKRSRLRQDDSAECCCSHHSCSKRLQLAHRSIDDLVTRSRWVGSRDGRTYLSAQTTHLSAVHGWAACQLKEPLLKTRTSGAAHDHSDDLRGAARCRRAIRNHTQLTLTPPPLSTAARAPPRRRAAPNRATRRSDHQYRSRQ